ncbi:response regulator [Desulfobacter sp.]|uniref:response regulator n=1 Tax=Desulfobacter sp. TaxID=2294 RepID=UPI003D13F261
MEKKFLQFFGYDTIARTGSGQALEILKANPDTFDLVITDLTMPGLTGDELARELKKIISSLLLILRPQWIITPISIQR